MDDQQRDQRISDIWYDTRGRLLNIAFGMLGNADDAEDVVQEGFTQLVRADLDALDDVTAWLVVVVSHRCLDRLRAAGRQKTTPTATFHDRFDADLTDPIDRITLDDRVRTALHLVLERLTPAERSAFIMHDVFGYQFERIGSIVGRSPEACRQLASRARRAVRADESSRQLSVGVTERLVVGEQFIRACETGDVSSLVAVLDPDVTGKADDGGLGIARPVKGREAIAETLMLFLGPSSRTRMRLLGSDDQLLIVGRRGDRVVVAATLEVRNDRVVDIDALVDPVRLEPLVAALGSFP